MKKTINLLTIFLLSGICTHAQNWQNKVDSINIVNRQLREYHQGSPTNFKIRGYIVPLDAGNNLYQGLNGTVTNGLNNYLGGDWISITNGSGNIVQANHAHIINSNGGAFFGADHGTDNPCSGDFGFVANDANENHGASGSVFGFFNKNWDENGWVGGSECINGTPGQPNADYSTFCFGYRAWNRGDCSQTQGTYVKNISDYSMAWGFGKHASNIYGMNTEDGVLVWFNNSTIPLLKLKEATTAQPYGQYDILSEIHAPNIPEYPDNAAAYADKGAGVIYYTQVGDEQILKLSHEPSFFMAAEPSQNNPTTTTKTISLEQAQTMKGTWYNIQGQAVTNPGTGVFYFIESK